FSGWNAHDSRGRRHTFDETQIASALTRNNRARVDSILIHNKHHALAITLNDGAGRQQHAFWYFCCFSTGFYGLHKRHARAHIRQYARVFLIESNAYFYGGLAAIGSW